jgi:hypothetical protein
MFNSPILDVAIGLTLVFLLYSLLATSINEAVATLFTLRARMLRKAVQEGMLSNTPGYGKITSLLMGIVRFFSELIQLIAPSRVGIFIDNKLKNVSGLGGKFYEHPIIKNYGSNKVFSIPSYLAANNFSTVLIDVLQQDFEDKIQLIAKSKLGLDFKEEQLVNLITQLKSMTNEDKMNELFIFYNKCVADNKLSEVLPDVETLQILNLHWKNSQNSLVEFTKKLESWFNDTMNRVSGWYKRQTQFILFFLGIILAVAFNIDSIGIASKLSEDKSVREKMVQLAAKAADEYKDDARVKENSNIKLDSLQTDSVFAIYNNNIKQANKLIQGNVASANSILQMGWVGIDKLSSWDKIWFVLTETFTSGRKLLGFLITAFAISLGAPFWFDLLNKLMKVRSTGKDESTDNKTTSK